MFDWAGFFNEHNIEYATGGRNVSKGNIAIKCPFCVDDPSQHMNVSLQGKGWACWRDADHRGTSVAKLVQQLLNTSWSEASVIAGGEDTSVPPAEAYMQRLAELYPGEVVTRRRQLATPKGWTPLAGAKGPTANLLYAYLRDRKGGYGRHDATSIAQRYDLQYTMSDKWQKRVIFPIRDEYGNLVNYTGRSISDRAVVRYRTLSGSEAAMRMSECVLDLPRLLRTEGEALVVCEGPMDVARISWLGEPLGVYATCIFTQNITDEQAGLLQRLSANFNRTFIVFDRAALIHSLKAQALVPGSELGFVPEGVKDPGDLTPSQALMLCREWCSHVL